MMMRLFVQKLQQLKNHWLKSRLGIHVFWRFSPLFILEVLSLFIVFNTHPPQIMKTSGQLTPRKKTAILALRQNGISNRQIAGQLDFSHTSINQFVKKVEETGSIDRKSGTGFGNKVTTPAQDRKLKQLSLADRHASANELRVRLKRSCRVDVSRRTINDRLRQIG